MFPISHVCRIESLEERVTPSVSTNLAVAAPGQSVEILWSHVTNPSYILIYAHGATVPIRLPIHAQSGELHWTVPENFAQGTAKIVAGPFTDMILIHSRGSGG